ncbi:NAD(P)/FAD-dependent oxidoreductase [soil metagenome]
MNADAVVIGSGPNGLVAANLLADADWSVTVLEAGPEPGGAVRTAEVTAPGFRNDLFSAFYPLSAASEVIGGLGLDRYGLRWRRAPDVLAHPTPDGPAAVLSTDLDRTAASLDRFARGAGERWRELFARWQAVRDPLLQALLAPFPPVRGSLGLARVLGARGALEFARFGLVPARRLAEESFAGAGGGLLLAGNAAHTDLAPESAGSALFGWLLASIGQDIGWPVPEGGAQSLTDALVARLLDHGGTLECGAPVTAITVRRGRATAVTVARGEQVDAQRAVLADVGAPALYQRLLDREHVPARLRTAIDRFQYGDATVKVDWALRRPIPWTDPDVAGAGTVHVGSSLDELTFTSAQLATGRIPSHPFLLLGQMTTTDPTRSPPGTESVWAYTHVPQRVKGDAGGDLTGRWDERESHAFAARIEARIEALAPGFGDLIEARHLLTPVSFEAGNSNLVGGALDGGSAALHQQLVFRPVPGLGRAETPVKGLYLASSSAHPGGGVHGACGANAARAALFHDRFARWRPGGRMVGPGVG